MALLNYTTTIKVEKTIGEIQGILVKHGARAILSDYDVDGHINSISFQVETFKGIISIKLPANTESVLQVLKHQKRRSNNSSIKDTYDQAERCSWRIIKDWVEAQMAILETEMVKFEEVFLPYIITSSGQTVFQKYESNQLLLKDSAVNEEVNQ